MLIKNNLAKLRTEHKAKQSEIAAVAGVSQGMYSMAETGQSLMPPINLWNVCGYYDVPPDDIYPAWVLKEVYGMEREPPKPKIRKAVSVKLPIAIADKVDAIVESGEYLNRTDFVVAAVRAKLGM